MEMSTHTAAMKNRLLPVSLSVVLCLFVFSFSVRAAELDFSQLYAAEGVLGMRFSDELLALNGKSVSIKGFMAPPLKADAVFFVLTRQPVALCPFCNSEADWPADIIVAYMAEGERFVQNNEPIEAVGTLEVGSATDPTTGFVSLIRLRNVKVNRL